MKKFVLRTLGFGCFFTVVFLILVGIMVRNYRGHHVYLDEYGHKVALLKDTPSPRVVLLGGSNVAFGIDSRTVGDSLGVNVVNYGLQAGLGLRLMLSDAFEYCRKGDVLVIAPEYEHFYGVADGEKLTLSVIALMYPQVIASFRTRQFMVGLGGMKDALYMMTYRMLSGGSSHEGVDDSYPYSALSFNSYGDEEAHWSVDTGGMVVKANYLSHDFDEVFFSDLCRDISELEGRGVDVVLIPPSVYREFYEGSGEKMQYVGRRLAEAGRPFACPIDSCVFDREDIFDSYYHLSGSGTVKRTKVLIDLLRQNDVFLRKSKKMNQKV